MPFIAELHTHVSIVTHCTTLTHPSLLMYSCSSPQLHVVPVGISVAMTFILSFSLGGLVTAIIICGCYNPRRFSSKTAKSPPPVEDNAIELESNSAYGTGRH